MIAITIDTVPACRIYHIVLHIKGTIYLVQKYKKLMFVILRHFTTYDFKLIMLLGRLYRKLNVLKNIYHRDAFYLCAA